MTPLEPRPEQAPVVLARTPAFHLGPVEVRPATRELIGPGGREQLEPRVMQVLTALARAGGGIVTREDLTESCWDGRIVGQDAINRVVSRLRHLAETVGGGAFRVETLVKVGYRLTVAGAAAGPVSDVGPATRAANRRAAVFGVAAVALGAGGAGGWWLMRREARRPPAAAVQLRNQGVEASRLGSAESTAQGIGFLQQAVALAPGYADGWASLALAYQGSQHFLRDDAADAAGQRSVSAASRALELDPDNAGAHAAQALALEPFGAWLPAERALRKVLALQADQFETCSALSRLLSAVGRTREALAALDPIAEQIRLQPALQYWRAFLLWAAGRLEESDQVIDRAMSLWPRSYQVWFTRFWLYARTGRGDRALAMSADASHRPTGIPEWNFELIDRTARALMTRDAADIAASLEANLRYARTGAGFAENAIEFAADVGRLDPAFAVADAYYFGRGFAIGSARYSAQQASYTPPKRRQTTFLFNPTTARLRADPRFASLVRALGLADYWRASGTTADSYRPAG